jgi:hypothetical protein
MPAAGGPVMHVCDLVLDDGEVGRPLDDREPVPEGAAKLLRLRSAEVHQVKGADQRRNGTRRVTVRGRRSSSGTARRGVNLIAQWGHSLGGRGRAHAATSRRAMGRG